MAAAAQSRVRSPTSSLSSIKSSVLVLDLCWRPPESGDLWYKSNQLKKTRCSNAEQWLLLLNRGCVPPPAFFSLSLSHSLTLAHFLSFDLTRALPLALCVERLV